MFGGAIEVASDDSVTMTLAARALSNAARASPCSANRSSECVEKLRGVDDLIPYLVAGGRRVVTFDFLGFGVSDKSPGATYSFKQQLGDLDAVVAALGLDRIVPGCA